MNSLISAALLLLLTTLASAAWQDDYALLLEKYVKADGVDYADWHTSEVDKARLAAVVAAIGDEQPPEQDEQALPYYLNVYNAQILHRIVDAPAIRGVGGNALTRGLFFKKKNLPLAGEKVSFDVLEHEIIRKRFAEPRIHFALNCASASCPPLMARPFAAETLDADLDALASTYINENPLGLSIQGDQVALSEIFNWFAEDFGGEAGVRAFIERYRETALPENAVIVFQEYDWSLNASEE